MNLRTRLLGLALGCAAIIGAVALAHAATLRTTINTSVAASYAGSADLGSATYTLQAGSQSPIILGSGTGSNQANAIFTDQRTLSASTTEELDLYGSLTDPLGGTLNFATIKMIKVCPASANTNNVNVGPGMSNGGTAFTGPWSASTAYSAVRPGGCMVHVAPQTGWTVTNTTGDKLGLGNSSSGTSVTYDIMIVGTQ